MYILLHITTNQKRATGGFFVCRGAETSDKASNQVAQESSSEFNQSFPAKTRPSWQGTANDKTNSHIVPVADADVKANSKCKSCLSASFLHKKFM